MHALPFNFSLLAQNANLSGLFDNASWPQMFFDDEFSPEVQTLLSVIYSLTILLAVVGNILVIVVLIFGNRVKTELTVFLLNLAVADLCMACFCMPFTFTEVMIGRWVFGTFMCPYVSFMQVTSVSVSIFTNMAIGIDRFWGVIYPLKRKLTRTRAKMALVVIWLAAGTLALAQLIVSRARRMETYSGVTSSVWMCDEVWESENSRKAYTVAIGAFTYAVPLLVITFTYYKVGSKLWVRSAPGNAHQSRDQILLRSKRKIIKMVVALVLAFAICWLPLQTFNLLVEFNHSFSLPTTRLAEQIFFGIYITCHWMAMANSFLNPIIYSFLNESFRADLKALFWWLPCLKRLRDSQQADVLTYTMSTRTSWAVQSRTGSRHTRLVKATSNTASLRPNTEPTPVSSSQVQNGTSIEKLQPQLLSRKSPSDSSPLNGDSRSLTRTLLSKPERGQQGQWVESEY